MTSLYDIPFNLADGSNQTLARHKGQVILIVNTASKCGLTPQFEGLQELHDKYADKGLVILGFPCNQFRNQDPGSIQEITEFCQLNYNVSFPIAEKIEVNGESAHPLYSYLKSSAKGVFGSEAIKWNFTKFLINREGNTITRFAPTSKPKSLEQEIAKAL